MGPRSLLVSFVAGSSALALGLAVLVAPGRAGAIDAAAPGAWLRPVDGRVVRPFVEPRSRYGAGHRGVDFATAPGTPVRAANAGEVTFAGSVAGSLHVVVAHGSGLRTSSSFLTSVAVRRGQQVDRGTVLGTAGGGTGEHAGVLHFGLRVGDRYVDPMVLFAPADLTRLIRLVPADTPAQRGIDPPALERRALADALHLPRGIPGVESADDGSGVLEAAGAVLGGAAELATAPVRVPAELMGTGASWMWRRAMELPPVADGLAAADRLRAWLESRDDCVGETSSPPGGKGSGHLAVTVAGINSATNAKTGSALAIDARRLGYQAGEVRSFSYAPDGGAYDRAQTWQDIRDSARMLGRQLRALQREQPGREVDLIAHSQGGVVVAEFLVHQYDAADPSLPPLGTVVTLAAPLQGAPAATAAARVRESASGRRALGAVDRVGGGALPPSDATATRQLAEGSSLVRGIVGDSWPEQMDLTSIGGTDDIVVPADHAALPGGRSVTVDPAGVSDHTSILKDPKALDAVRLALEGRGLPCVGVATGIRGAIEPVLISRAEHTAGELGGAAGDAADVISRQGGRR